MKYKKSPQFFMVMGLLSVGMTSAYASSGVVNFTGSIVADSCTVNSGTTDVQVTLGNVSAGDLQSANDHSTHKNFSISLTECPANSNVAFRFDGEQDENNSNLLKITGGDTVATGVAIGLFNADGTALALGDDSTTFPIDGSGSGSANFQAAYISTGAGATAGEANGVANFTIIYD
ncbi:fimbrial protein [Vibrio algicola]|uniref:Fimbrial protein n=1 Tax=Vibrio algicola TaxID=2662262 RepID=A0A5Q0TM59_9VIBR|nr:fimbrial protein [Vibrio algicola]